MKSCFQLKIWNFFENFFSFSQITCAGQSKPTNFFGIFSRELSNGSKMVSTNNHGLPLEGHGQACKGMHPRPDFLSPSQFFPYLLLKPTQKRDGKPTLNSSLSQAWVLPNVWGIIFFDP